MSKLRPILLTPEQQTLVEDHLPGLVAMADRVAYHLRGNVEPGDLYGYGWHGLAKAAKAWIPEEGKFWTYAQHRVRGAMLDMVREMDWAPRLMRKRNTAPVHISLNKVVYHGTDTSKPMEFGDLLPGDAPPVGLVVERQEAFRRAVRGLPLRVRAMLWMYYGEEFTMDEIARAYKMSEARVSQLLSTARTRLAKTLRRLGLRGKDKT